MRIVVFVFFYFKCPVLFFKLYTDVNIHINIIRVIFIIFYKAIAELTKTIYKFSFDNSLYSLVTDAGFLNRPKVVWETLTNVDGDERFCNSNFEFYDGKDSKQDLAAQSQSTPALNDE